MKAIRIFLFSLLALLITSGCETKSIVKKSASQDAVAIENSEMNCANCSMPVADTDYAAQAALDDGNNLFFDDIGCMMTWRKKSNRSDVKFWVNTLDTHRWIDATKAFYQAGDTTPMGFGYGAYENAPSPHIDFAILTTRF